MSLTCRLCGSEPSEGNPVYPGSWAYLNAFLPLALCLECVAAIQNDALERAETANLEDAA